MKQWIRRAVLLVCLMFSFAVLAACGSTEKTVQPLDDSTRQSLEQSGRQTMEALGSYDTAQLDSMLEQAELDKNEVVYNGITNYKNSLERLGEFQSVDSVTAEATEDGSRMEIMSTYSKRNMKLILGFDRKNQLTEMTFDPIYTVGEQLQDAGSNLIIGMGTVFVVLIFIAWIISLMKYVNVFEKKMKNKGVKEVAPTPKKPAAPAATAPAVRAAAAPAPVSGAELEAVIAAAIAAYEADNAENAGGFTAGPTLNNGLVVRSIRRR